MTERAARTPPRTALGPLELRLYATAALAIVYLFAWRAITGRAPVGPAADRPAGTAASDRVAAGAPAALGAPRAAAVWLDDLPAWARPAVVIPPGWRLAARGEAIVAAPAPRVVRAPAGRPLRVRTRSS